MDDRDKTKEELLAELAHLRQSEQRLQTTIADLRDLTALRKAKDELELRVVERTAELLQVNQQLQREQERFAGILEIASDAIISINAQQKITLFNQGAEQIFGYSAPDVLGQPLDILLPLGAIASHRQHVQGFDHTAPRSARKMGDRQEIYGRRQDGSEFPAEASISKLELGTEKVFTVILRDISQRKQAEEALERLSRQNQLILNSMGEGLCGIDLQGQITFTNPAAARLLGYRVEELTEQPIALILPHNSPDGAPYRIEDSPIYAALREGAVYEGVNERFRRRDGTTFPVEYISTPILEKGQILGAVVTFRDITERQVVERMKDEFISVVSHELRTPLTSIHGSLGMLASGLLKADPQTSQRLLEIAVNSTDRLVRLINDILDIERIESGKVTMAKQSCDALELLTDAADVMQAMAERLEVNLEVSPLPVSLWVDPDRILQTLTNLLSNAIKFSPKGSTVRLQASLLEASDRDPSELLITVADQGRGIPPDKLETIFERFQQVDASDSRNHDGTGLGLAICRSIVQQHGGRIWVESEVGQGSTFCFTLPLMPQNLNAPTNHSGKPLILVCDDDLRIRSTLQTMLEGRNYQVISVATGEEAITQAIAHRPDSILLDLLLPGMNGWDVMATLKSRPDTRSIPIIICSVCSPPEEPPGNDFVDWVEKPLDEVSLFQSLRQALARSADSVRVLVVEDDLDLAQVLVTMLESHGIETCHAPTRREAIRLSQQLHPDLLVLDLVLPDGDGFEVVEWLQQHNQLSSVPLLVYSAQDVDARQRDRLHLGQTEFLTKGSVTIQEFEHRVTELLQRMTQNRRQEEDSEY